MKKLVSIGLAVLFVFACFQIAWADKPTPEPTPPGKSGRTPPGLSKNELAPREKPPEKPNQRHALFGTVAAIGSGSFTLSTKDGDEMIAVLSSTKFHIPGIRSATLGDLAINDRVAVNGTPTADGLNARKVAVAPGKPTIQHRVGKVVAYTAGSSIVIESTQGKSGTFTLNSQTVIRGPKADEVTVGDRVTVVSSRDPAKDEFTARAIVVHPN